MSLLTLENVKKNFGGVQAVTNATMHVDEGEIFGLIGPNGAGKTTTVNLITGYFEPTSGTIELAGESVTGVRPHRLAARRLARTFQNLQLFDGVSVLDNVLIGRHLSFQGRRWQLWSTRRREEREQQRRAFELLDQLDLVELADDDVTDLPYGIRRRVEIARALAVEPRLLLLDEPTAGMTRKESDEIGELIKRVNGLGVTIFLVEHNVRLVTEVCHRVAVLDWGAVVVEGTPHEVWQDQRVKEAYLGVAGASKAATSELATGQSRQEEG